jgi:hypothetical protein
MRLSSGGACQRRAKTDQLTPRPGQFSRAVDSAEPVGGRAGFDDVRVEGEPVDDGRRRPSGVGERGATQGRPARPGHEGRRLKPSLTSSDVSLWLAYVYQLK